jgi:hypothetical protein
MMLEKLENWSGWYAEAPSRKVKYLMCEALFARKPTRMLRHLGYQGPSGICNKGVLLCGRATAEIRRLFKECGGIFPLYSRGVGVALLDSSHTSRVGGLYALWQSTP